MAKFKRHWRNYLLDPGFQLRFCGIVVGVSLLFSIFIGVFFYLRMDSASEVLREIFTDIDCNEIPPLVAINSFLVDQMRPIIVSMIFLLVCYFIFTSAFVILETHKVVGAEYAIKRFIREKMAKKQFSERIYLRKKDYLKDLANSINEMAEALEGESDQPEKKPEV